MRMHISSHLVCSCFYFVLFFFLSHWNTHLIQRWILERKFRMSPEHTVNLNKQIYLQHWIISFLFYMCTNRIFVTKRCSQNTNALCGGPITDCYILFLLFKKNCCVFYFVSVANKLNNWTQFTMNNDCPSIYIQTRTDEHSKNISRLKMYKIKIKKQFWNFVSVQLMQYKKSQCSIRNRSTLPRYDNFFARKLKLNWATRKTVSEQDEFEMPTDYVGRLLLATQVFLVRQPAELVAPYTNTVRFIRCLRLRCLCRRRRMGRANAS